MRLICLLLLANIILSAQAPKLFLLKTYKDNMNVIGWVMSEKLDGVRAFWDGKKLISRSGRLLNPPRSFTKGFPPFALDGELWSKRGSFEGVVSVVNTKNTKENWDKLDFHVFEVPYQKGDLYARLEVLKTYLRTNTVKKLSIIKQAKIEKKSDIKTFYDDIISGGGEGIVIRNPHQPYYTGRRQAALKYKPFFDDECRVTSIIEGKGKFLGKMGAIQCDFDGKIIKVG
ncbi:MAG: DNA ligase, partial [Sulfurimonas sp.]|nr:DNA ligase [Sulfurimonas sp.]